MSGIWNIPRIWEGETVFIIGGGYSILSQFGIPDRVIKKVNNKKAKLSAYSRYMKQLHKKNVIGINVAYQLGSWIDFIYFTDESFLVMHDAQLKRHKATKVTGFDFDERFNYCKRVKQPVKPYGICTEKNTVFQNRNSGAGAINLAYHLGAKTIVLIGFDGMEIKGRIHFHTEYKNTILERVTHPIDTEKQPYPDIKRDSDNLGIKIVNTSFASKITEFIKRPIEKYY
jgi:hypothetical protein